MVSSLQSAVPSGSSHQRVNKRSSRGSNTPEPGPNQHDKLRFLVVNAKQCERESGRAWAYLRLHKARHLGLVRDQIKKSVCSAEFLPKCYMAIQKDRTLLGRGHHDRCTSRPYRGQNPTQGYIEGLQIGFCQSNIGWKSHSPFGGSILQIIIESVKTTFMYNMRVRTEVLCRK